MEPIAIDPPMPHPKSQAANAPPTSVTTTCNTPTAAPCRPNATSFSRVISRPIVNSNSATPNSATYCTSRWSLCTHPSKPGPTNMPPTTAPTMLLKRSRSATTPSNDATDSSTTRSVMTSQPFMRLPYQQGQAAATFPWIAGAFRYALRREAHQPWRARMAKPCRPPSPTVFHTESAHQYSP